MTHTQKSKFVEPDDYPLLWAKINKLFDSSNSFGIDNLVNDESLPIDLLRNQNTVLGSRVNEFQKKWKNKKKRVSGTGLPSVRSILWKVFLGDLIGTIAINVLTEVFDLWVITFLLDRLISYFHDGSPLNVGFTYAGLLFLATQVVIILWEWYWQKMAKIRLAMRSTLLCLIHEHSGNLKSNVHSKYSGGKLMTIITTDVEKISRQIHTLSATIRTPVKIATCFYLLQCVQKNLVRLPKFDHS